MFVVGICEDNDILNVNDIVLKDHVLKDFILGYTIVAGPLQSPCCMIPLWKYPMCVRKAECCS